MSYNNQKYKLTFRDFREANVSVISVDSTSFSYRLRDRFPAMNTWTLFAVKKKIWIS
jgi:hypothetical protein